MNDLFKKIDQVIREKSLLKHPFYQAWSMGSLPLESLREYALQYYHFEAAYPRFLSGLHHRCPDQNIRQLLLDNLWDEEHGSENHVELWLRFCEALNLDRQDVRVGEPNGATSELVNTYESLTSTGSLAAGAVALYAFESQIPEVAKEKIRGLAQFYGMDDPQAISFFQVHKTLDEAHSEAERNMVGSLVSSNDDEIESIQAVKSATYALWRFLDSVY